MLFVEEVTFPLDLGSWVWTKRWESAPLAGASEGLRVGAAIVGCRLTYRDGDHKVLQLSFAAEAHVIPSSGAGPKVGLRIATLLRDDSILDGGSTIHPEPGEFWRRTGIDVKVDDDVVGELRVLIFATDDPSIGIVHGISDGTGMLRTPQSSPGAAALPAARVVPTANTTRALFLAGANLEFIPDDHDVQRIEARLTGTARPEGYRVEGRALIRDDGLDDIHQGRLFFTVLDLPSARYQVGEADLSMSGVGRQPENAPVQAKIAAMPGMIVGMRGFWVDFPNGAHHLRTFTVGLTRGRITDGGAVAAYAGISHQDHWNEPYRGTIACTTVQGPIAALSSFTSAAPGPPPLALGPMGQVAPAAGWSFVGGTFVESQRVEQRADLFAYHPSNGTLWVGTHDRGGYAFQTWGSVSPAAGWQFIGGSFTGSGRTDLIGYYPATGTLWLAVNTGSAFEIRPFGSVEPKDGWQFVAGHFAGRERADLFGYQPSNGTLWVGENDGRQLSFRQWGTVSPAAEWQFVVGSFGGDSRVDIAGYHPSNGTLWIGENLGDRFVLRQAGTLAPAAGWQLAAYSTAGRPTTDLFAYHPGDGTIGIAENRGGSFTFSRRSVIAPKRDWRFVTRPFAPGAEAGLRGYQASNGTLWGVR
jgi:hypothetical protein